MRERMRALRSAADPAERRRWSHAVCETVRAHPWWRRASVVALYAPMEEEVAVGLLLSEAWAEGKTVALPRTNRREGRMWLTLHAVERNTPLLNDRWGIAEPPADRPEVAPSAVESWIVPGLAFDRSGGRLGYGKALYDQVLAGRKARTIGVAFEFQRVDRLPLEPHDVRMKAVVTPAGWHPAERPRRDGE